MNRERRELLLKREKLSVARIESDVLRDELSTGDKDRIQSSTRYEKKELRADASSARRAAARAKNNVDVNVDFSNIYGSKSEDATNAVELQEQKKKKKRVTRNRGSSWEKLKTNNLAKTIEKSVLSSSWNNRTISSGDRQCEDIGVNKSNIKKFNVCGTLSAARKYSTEDE